MRCPLDMLCKTQSEAQRLIAKHIGAHPFWTSDVTDSSKWRGLVEKFNLKYETDISPAARQWRKKRGQCCAHLIAAPLPDDRLRWVLLVTDHGNGPVKQQELLHDVRNEHLVWGDYLLIHATRRREFGGGARWTWFMSSRIEKQEADYLTGLAQSAGRERRPERLRAYLDVLLKRPMHSGVRQQVAKMMRRAQKVWAKHSHGMPWPGPELVDIPAFGRYLPQARYHSQVAPQARER